MRQLTVCLIWMIATGVSAGQDVTSPPATSTAYEGQPDQSAQEAIHTELRALRERMFDAYEKRDMDALLKDVAPDVVITWQNMDRNVGHEEFREFYDRMMNSDNGVVKNISSEFEVDGVSFLYGNNTAVARGTQADTFTLNDGSHFTLNSKWTATVVRQENGWKVASFHVSSNIFDNPILDVAKGWLLKAGLAGGLIGMFIGLLIGRATRRKPTAA